VHRRSVLGGALAVGGLLAAGCQTGKNTGEVPAVPWPDGDTVGIGMQPRLNSCRLDLNHS
jgi:hypothetical protein